MRITHFNGRNPTRGTGFLSDGYLFLTAAHCVRDSKHNNCKANLVYLYFGLDQDDHSNSPQVRRLSLEGKDFTVPDAYKKHMDPFDIAWINLKEYFDKKSTNSIPLNWTLDDLPSSSFIKCKTPVSMIPGGFSLSGNL